MSSEDARLDNLEPFLFPYRNEHRTRLQCGQYITKAQWDWYNSPTSRLPLPTTLEVVDLLDRAMIKPLLTPELTNGSSSLDSSPLGPPLLRRLPYNRQAILGPKSLSLMPFLYMSSSSYSIQQCLMSFDSTCSDTSGPCALVRLSGAPILRNSTADVAAANSDAIPTYLQLSAISIVQLDPKFDRPVKPIGRKYLGGRRIQQLPRVS
ncbi:hypothetical protein FRC03_007909 [Tulasnella sp. 419]|nr:hypothetical protein FRC03_007909 [Tulasnella sp. 419]